MITLRNVHKRFGHFNAIRAVSLHIKSGEIHGIVGASGAGKTTLLRMMNFLEQPDKGEVVVRDRKSTRLNSSHVAISYAVFCLKKKKQKKSKRNKGAGNN